MDTAKNTIRMVFITALAVIFSASVQAGPHHHGGGHDEHHQEEAKGPNGGKLLVDGGVVVELSIFERDVPPEYRAWIAQNGKPVEAAKLTVQLDRLDGEVNLFNFRQEGAYLRGDGVVTEPHSFDVTVAATVEGKQYQWKYPSYEGRVQLSDAMAEKVGITTTTAGPGIINETTKLYGRVVPGHENESHMRARFPGLITKVNVNIGDRVKKGDVLIEIESNESLKRYFMVAPFDALVTSRHANPGEFASEQELLTLINDQSPWAEVLVFAKHGRAVRNGQTVEVTSGPMSATTVIEHIVPDADGKPFMVAHLLLKNGPLNGEQPRWISGMMLEAQVQTSQIDAPLVVDNRALQGFRDFTVVFAKIGETYEVRMLELGRTDGRFTEVLGGLKPGTEYVVENSYLLKADLEKSGAAHHH
ncbi:HlyD family efflux transporter periplasmic adaptor subunit [bacterium SCSIO 12696]|nr:HlyD family efflux transporter periplasmic adaptor subunit [bacterium SCSIO 12696]